MTSAAPISAFADVAACHTELLRQRIAFEEELRAQKSYYDTKLKEVNEQLGFREVDCRNLQTVVTILGRKLDALSSVVEGLVLEQQHLQQNKGRYPPKRAPSTAASFTSVFSPYEATSEYNHGMHAAGVGRPRSGSVGSTASSSAMGVRGVHVGVPGTEKYSAFGRTNSSAFTPRSTFPEEKVRPPSPSHPAVTSLRREEKIVTTTMSTAVETSRTTSVTTTDNEHVRGLTSDDSGDVVGKGAVVVPPQHSYIIGQRENETEFVGTADNTESPTLDKGNVPPDQRELRTVVAVPSAASRAAVAAARPSLNGNTRTNNTKKEMFLPCGPSASSRSLPLSSSADTSVAAAAPTPTLRPPSPRSLAFASAYRPVDALLGGNGSAVGLRGPTPTRVARVTPERLRDRR